MATATLFTKPNKTKKENIKIPVYVKLTHANDRKYFPVPNVKVEQDHFDFKTFQCKKTHTQYLTFNEAINAYCYKINQIITIDLIVDKPYLPTAAAFFDYVERKLENGDGQLSLKNMCEKVAQEHAELGRKGNARAYEIAVKQFTQWMGKDMPMKDITYQMFYDYKIHLEKEGKVGAAYFRAYRALYKRAVREDRIDEKQNPFRKGNLVPQVDTSEKENNYTLEHIRTIIKHRTILPSGTNLWMAANYLTMQYYLQGPDGVEIMRLTDHNVIDGYIHFTRYKNRSKVKRTVVKVKITPEMQEVMDDIRIPGCPMLVPILEGFDVLPNGYVDVEKDYALYNTRRGNLADDIRELCKLLEIEHMGTKSGRFLYSKVARQVLNVREEDLKSLMGHSKGISFVYSDHAQATLDEINRKMIDLSKPETKVIALNQTA